MLTPQEIQGFRQKYQINPTNAPTPANPNPTPSRGSLNPLSDISSDFQETGQDIKNTFSQTFNRGGTVDTALEASRSGEQGSLRGLGQAFGAAASLAFATTLSDKMLIPQQDEAQMGQPTEGVPTESPENAPPQQETPEPMEDTRFADLEGKMTSEIEKLREELKTAVSNEEKHKKEMDEFKKTLKEILNDK